MWRLIGFDTFDGEEYPLEGEYETEEAARAAAQARVEHLERTQPTSSSGGQDGIQDRVYIQAPDGSRTRYVGLRAVR